MEYSTATNTNLTLTLTDLKILNSRMRHFVFTLPVSQKLTYLPGQFISLFFANNTNITRRNFSIANAPDLNKDPTQPQILEIAASFVPNGLASTKLWSLKLGDQLTAAGPFGIFVLRPAEIKLAKRYILIATGTGVTPYRAMLPTIAKIIQTKDLKFVLLLGARDQSELLYAEDFINFAKYYPNFQFIACYSRVPYDQAKANPLLQDHEDHNVRLFQAPQACFGYVQEHLHNLDPDPKNDLFYLCGNPNMVDQTFTKLEFTYKISREKIKREKYISSK